MHSRNDPKKKLQLCEIAKPVPPSPQMLCLFDLKLTISCIEKAAGKSTDLAGSGRHEAGCHAQDFP
jgi:hypothetical protein